MMLSYCQPSYLHGHSALVRASSRHSDVKGLSRNHRLRLSGLRFDDLQTELDGSFLESLHLLLLVSVLVVLETLVDVLVSPLEHAIHQAGQLVRHGGDRLRRTAYCPITRSECVGTLSNNIDREVRPRLSEWNTFGRLA